MKLWNGVKGIVSERIAPRHPALGPVAALLRPIELSDAVCERCEAYPAEVAVPIGEKDYALCTGCERKVA